MHPEDYAGSCRCEPRDSLGGKGAAFSNTTTNFKQHITVYFLGIYKIVSTRFENNLFRKLIIYKAKEDITRLKLDKQLLPDLGYKKC